MRDLSYAVVGLAAFLLVDWLMFAYTLADAAWPVSALTWPSDYSPGRFILFAIAAIGSVGSVIAGVVIAHDE